MNCSTPGFPIYQQLLQFTQTHVNRVGDAIQPSHSLSSSSSSGLNLSQYQGHFKGVSSLHQVAKYRRFSFNISPSNEHQDLSPLGWTGWISKASILQCSAFIIVQLSHPYMTIGKTIALTKQTFVDKVISLLFNMLSRLVITPFQGISIF